MDTNHDYQNEMSVDTRSIDTAGEQAADATDAQTAPVGEEKVSETRGDGTYSKIVGTFGVLPELEIPTDFARSRMLAFKHMAIETGTRRNPLNALQSAQHTAAFKSQSKMAELYLEDQSLISTAQRHYDLLVPVASMAAKGFAKAHEIGRYTGLSDEQGTNLGAKEQRAMNKASRKLHGPLDEAPSLDAASSEIIAARHELEAACKQLAATVSTYTVQQLMKEYTTATDRQASIEAKIKKAQKVVGYLASGASVLAGGAGFIHDRISVGEPDPLAGKSIEEYDLRDDDVKAVKDAAGAVAGKKSAGSGVVAFGMHLYYEKELVKIASTQKVIGGLLAKHGAEAAKAEIHAVYIQFTAAGHRYANAVSGYQARVNDRRKRLATLGRTADQIVGGGNTNASDALLWTASIMETQSFLGIAIDSGRTADSTLTKSHGEVRKHRTHHWGTLGDIYGGTNTPRTEGEAGPDLLALKSMRNRVSNWLDGATDVSKTVNKVAETQGEPALQAVGYTGKY